MTTTRSRLIATLLGLVALAFGLLSPYAMGTRAATPDRILVYWGNNAAGQTYTRLGAAAGRPVDTLFALPDDLSAYACIVLPVNGMAFSAAQKAGLASYVNSGGRILALGDHSGFASGNATMNDLAATLGVGMSIVNASLDGGYWTTTNIAPTPLTAGVAKIRYAGVSTVTVADGGPGQILARTIGGSTFIAAAPVGAGLFLLSGDSNTFSDFSEQGYALYHNGVLARNLCGEANQPPSVEADQATVTATEGQTATNSGTVSDPDGETVALTASLGTVVNNGNGSWSWSYQTTDGPAESQAVTISAADGKGGSAQVSFALAVENAAPTITWLSISEQGLAGQPLSATGTATDSSSDDTAAGFTWLWAIDGGAYTPGANPASVGFANCGSHTVTARAEDRDGGVSQPVSATVAVYEARFLAPLEQGRYNAVRAGRVVPVQVAVGCDGAAQPGLAPAIQLLKGDASAGEESGTIPVETTSASAADTTGVMRPVEGGYLYNLQVPGDAKAGDLYTIRVRPFGDAQPGAGITVVLAIK